ncbi:MAG: GntR family transcriptional regulator [Angelakisella sp.]|nr:GntR family transcriptional regulator [Angelakisella sp.]
MITGPAYAQVYNTIKREIMEGEYPIGSLLPPEPVMEKRFGVSRTTIRRAMDLLSRDGFIKAQQGFGTQVLDYKTRQNLNVITSVSETLRRKGHIVEPRSMYIDIVNPGAQILQELNLQESDKVARVQRIQIADGKPLAIIKNYISAVRVPGIEQHVDEIHSLYQYLEDRYNIVIESAHDSISARSADFAEAQMLEVPVGSALLCMKRVCYSGSQPICADRLSILGDRYELEVNMVGRSK